MKTRIEIDKTHISLYPAGDSIMSDIGYNIELTRCNTPEKILGWMEHLAAKNWIDTKTIFEFSEIAFGKIGIQADRRL